MDRPNWVVGSYLEVLGPNPPSSWINLIWRKGMDEGGRQSKDTNQGPQSIVQLLGDRWGDWWWWGGWVLRPCSLQLVPWDWEHTASGPACTFWAQAAWPEAKQRSSCLPGEARAAGNPNTSDYRRVQLMTFLSQMIPSLKLGLCKASPQEGACREPAGGQVCAGSPGLAFYTAPPATSCQGQPRKSTPQVRAAKGWFGYRRTGKTEEEGAF